MILRTSKDRVLSLSARSKKGQKKFLEEKRKFSGSFSPIGGSSANFFKVLKARVLQVLGEFKLRFQHNFDFCQRLVGDGPIHDFSDSVTRNELMVVYVRVEFLDERSAILDTIANGGAQPNTLICDMHTGIRGVTESRKRHGNYCIDLNMDIVSPKGDDAKWMGAKQTARASPAHLGKPIRLWLGDIQAMQHQQESVAEPCEKRIAGYVQSDPLIKRQSFFSQGTKRFHLDIQKIKVIIGCLILLGLFRKEPNLNEIREHHTSVGSLGPFGWFAAISTLYFGFVSRGGLFQSTNSLLRCQRLLKLELAIAGPI
ncbi:hypothetical protein VNO77_02848 [Canavalia gladiata]|uniref:Uncharacterized protein n=1 Tax=Canavalia gladiata TaxID=3824 RepID=A0AAN9N070_CANGL